MKYVCEECGWRPAPGMFVEVNMSPDELSWAGPRVLAPYVETEHFLRDGCRGSVEPQAEEGEAF